MKTNHWGWMKVLLWAYSTLYSVFFIIVFLYNSFYPQATDASGPNAMGNIIALIMSIPVIVFLIGEGIDHLPSHNKVTSV